MDALSLRMFIEITQTNQEVAERYFSRNNNDFAAAIADYFDNVLADQANETNHEENNNSTHDEHSHNSDQSTDDNQDSQDSPMDEIIPLIYSEEEDTNDESPSKNLDSSCLISKNKPKNCDQEEKSPATHDFPRRRKHGKMKIIKIYSNGVLLDTKFYSKSDSQNYPIIEKNLQMGRIPQEYLSSNVADIEIVNLTSETYSP